MRRWPNCRRRRSQAARRNDDADCRRVKLTIMPVKLFRPDMASGEKLRALAKLKTSAIRLKTRRSLLKTPIKLFINIFTMSPACASTETPATSKQKTSSENLRCISATVGGDGGGGGEIVERALNVLMKRRLAAARVFMPRRARLSPCCTQIAARARDETRRRSPTPPFAQRPPLVRRLNTMFCVDCARFRH